jgi:hypothetical protein
LGYRIKYEGDMVITTTQPAMNKKAKRILCIAISICSIVMLLSVSSGLDKLKEWILPGNAKITETALNTFATDLKQGEPLDDAITAFCREILDHANTPR